MASSAIRFLEENGFFNYKNDNSFAEKIKSNVKNVKNQQFNLSYKGNSKALNEKILAIEMGGTNLKLTLLDFKESINIVKSQNMQFARDKVFTPELLFNELWMHIENFLNKEKIGKIAFVFAYGQKYEYTNGKLSSIVLEFGKELKSNGIIGMNITNSFKEFLKSRLGEVEVVVLNDTVASVLYLKYLEDFENKQFDKKINLIIGTGFNVGYITEDAEITVFNSQSGFFNTVKKTIFDEMVDRQTDAKKNDLEKMMSGKYIPMLFNAIMEKMNGRYKVEDMEQLIKLAENNEEAQHILNAIYERASFLVGTILTETIKHLGNKGSATILGEGSLFNKCKDYRKMIIEHMNKNTGVKLEIIEKDNSGAIGCAYLLSQIS